MGDETGQVRGSDHAGPLVPFVQEDDLHCQAVRVEGQEGTGRRQPFRGCCLRPGEQCTGQGVGTRGEEAHHGD